MSGKILRVLKGLYKNANVCIRKESGCVMEEFKTERGLRQGCQLSPILFTLYINGIIECLEKIETHSPSSKGGKEVKVLLYADDLVLLSVPSHQPRLPPKSADFTWTRGGKPPGSCASKPRCLKRDNPPQS